MSMVINRRSIILASLVVALGLAIFLNYRFSNDTNIAASAKTTTSNLGDAAYVDNQNVSSTKSDFFAAARLTRSQNRDQAEQLEKSITTSSSVTAAERQKATDTINQIAKDINTEGQIETQIKAKGFAECVCMITDGTASVVVKPKTSNSLSANDSAQIYDIVLASTKFAKTSIKIISQN
jgi:stage III sporulation protein AH